MSCNDYNAQRIQRATGHAADAIPEDFTIKYFSDEKKAVTVNLEMLSAELKDMLILSVWPLMEKIQADPQSLTRTCETKVFQKGRDQGDC